MSDEQHNKGQVIARELERLNKSVRRLSVLITIVSFASVGAALRIGKVEDFHHS